MTKRVIFLFLLLAFSSICFADEWSVNNLVQYEKEDRQIQRQYQQNSSDPALYRDFKNYLIQ
jgi:hypothetical protein